VAVSTIDDTSTNAISIT